MAETWWILTSATVGGITGESDGAAQNARDNSHGRYKTLRAVGSPVVGMIVIKLMIVWIPIVELTLLI